MTRIAVLFSVLALLLLPGCLAIGNGSGGEATMADEIRGLEELRDDGRISYQQYQAGVNKILCSEEPVMHYQPAQQYPQR